jgi:hypothetical protein
MKAIRSVNHKMGHVDFHVSNSVIRCRNELIHEHDFIPVAVNGSNTPVIRCTTCGTYYCELCGKALADVPIFILCA